MIKQFSPFGFGRFTLAALVVLCLPVFPAAADPAAMNNAQAQLISEVTAVQPGQSFWVALRLKIRDGWHLYWRNPGDSGTAPAIDWNLPAGLTAGSIHWPYPKRVPSGPLMNYGYYGDLYLLTEIQAADDLAVQPATLQADARWLACEEMCIPESATVALTLPVSQDPAPLDAQWSEAFAQTRAALPRPSPWPVTFSATDDTFTFHLSVSDLPSRQVDDAWFFPYEYGVIEYAAPQTLRTDGQTLSLDLTRGEMRGAPPDSVTGVLVLEQQTDGEPIHHAFQIEATPREAPAVPPSTGFPLREILLAFLGGIILNLMPCVFPVLSMKALSFVQHSHKDDWEIRLHGLIFTAGVLTCFAAIAGALIALRAGGAQIGWGFQLQSPVFVTLLAYLVFAVGLSLSGVFTFGAGLMGVGNELATRSGYLGSFATGALATVVATPCTAPFMGAALGFALTQPWQVSLIIFLALGMGLAFPYLTLSFFPPLFRFLPKPGLWMERVKELLAFPLYATAAWLVWVLVLQTGAAGVIAALAGMILIAFAAWLFQSTRTITSHWRLAGSVGAVATLAIALGVAGLPVLSNSGSSAFVANRQSNGYGPEWEPFSQQRLAELRAEGRPVFVNFTAAWCITCLANEQVALSSSRVAQEFDAAGIVYLKGDWTNRNAEITQMLQQFGRSGVPLYVFFPPNNGEPITLPQILTETIVLRELGLTVENLRGTPVDDLEVLSRLLP